MSISEINKRYSLLAESSCCLSCGGAVNYSKPLPGEICVDLGSGRGTDVFRMADEVGETGFSFGVDISDGMIEKANRTREKLGIKNVAFIRSELEKIDLPDETANLVISNCTINHATDKDAVWHEIFRILKPGGRFVISDIYASAPVPQEYRNDPVAVSECWAGAVTRKEYLDTVSSAGFTPMTILEESIPYPKGKIMVSSITLQGTKPDKSSDCCIE
jgi:ubiquinone/menaquinone biosynthesis C-methylase UbiE